MDGPLPDGFLHLLSWGDLPDANTPNKRTDFDDDTTEKTTTIGSESQPPLDYTDRHIAQENPPPATPEKIGRAHVCTPVTTAQHVRRLLLEKKKKTQHKS